MFDTVTGKFERGPYVPKPETKDCWETRTRDFYDSKLGSRFTSVSHTLSRQEARIAIYGDGGILTVEASLPKLLYGNNLMAVTDPAEALCRLREFVSTYVGGEIPDLHQMDYLRVDFSHNFQVGSALSDYVHTLSKVSFLKHRRTTDEHGGVEWWSDNGRRVRVYDKYKEILEQNKKAVAQARGILRFEIQLRKKSGFLQRRQHKKKLTLEDVLRPETAYGGLVETLDKMSLALDFQAQDGARNILDAKFAFRKSTRLLGILRRLEAGSMEDLKQVTSRSMYYSDKKDLRALGLWPPSAGPVTLPALELPPLETILSAEAKLCDSLSKEEAA
jgi:hypothetical protein